MNLPNKITTGRFALALMLFAYLVWTETCSGADIWAPFYVLVIFILAVSTDALDGYYARKLGQQSDFGRIADPVVDKVIVCGMFIFIVSTSWGRVYVPVWLAVLLVTREFLVSGLRGYIEARGVAFPARWDGKLKMVLQCVAVPSIFLTRHLDLGYGHEYPWLMDGSVILAHTAVWGCMAMTVSSGARYVLAAARELRSDG